MKLSRISFLLFVLALPGLFPGRAAAARPAKEKPVPAKTAPAPDVILFSKISNQADLAASLPKAMATPQLLAHLGELFRSYKTAVAGVSLSKDRKQLFLVGTDGSRHLYDDGRSKSAGELLEQSDLEDMFFYNYPLANPTDRLPVGFDPGRARPEAFFQMLYGDSPAAVEANLTTVEFAGKKVRFNRQHGAAEALTAVDRDLATAVKRKPELKLWLTNLEGTYSWRKIAGTTRLSTHSYGIAIDLNTTKSKYWRWEKPATLTTYSRLEFPVEIIAAFEKQGFVWGGKWYHYDTMHFEYRPEILHLATPGGSAPAVSAPAAALKAIPGDPALTPPPSTPAAPDATLPKKKRSAFLLDPGAPAGKSTATAALRAGLETCGFTVTQVSGESLGDCLAQLEKFTSDPPEDAQLFHFAGEAIYHDGDTWLIPAGAAISQPADVFAEALPLKRIVEAMAQNRAAARLVLLDIPPPSAAEEGVSPAAASPIRTPGFFFGFAASPAAPGIRSWQPGVFTTALAGKIATPQLSISDLFTLVVQEVTRTSAGSQNPRQSSTLSSIFRFVDPAAKAANTPVAAPVAPVPAAPAAASDPKQAPRE